MTWQDYEMDLGANPPSLTTSNVLLGSRRWKTARGGRGAQRGPRDRLYGLLVWIPAWAPLDALAHGISTTPVNWILDADIRSYFDKIDQTWLIRFLEHRIGDERIKRLVLKWLKAGVLDEGEWSVSETGTPQGAVISPLLANIYLHYVFDLWALQWRRREARGNVIIVRYADDWWSASSTNPMQGNSGTHCERGSSNSGSNFMRRRPGCWHSVASRRRGENSAVWESQKTFAFLGFYTASYEAVSAMVVMPDGPLRFFEDPVGSGWCRQVPAKATALVRD